MTDPASISVSGVWAIGAAALVGLLTLYAAAVDSVITARAEGQMPGAAARPLWKSARLMRQRRRTTVAADRLLWRIGGSGVVGVAPVVGGGGSFGPGGVFYLKVGGGGVQPGGGIVGGGGGVGGAGGDLAD